MQYKQGTDMFRDKDQIVRDVVFALCSTELHHAAKRAIVDQALWTWTEFDGKHSEKLRWSLAAKQSRADKDNFKNLVHEHAVPRKLFREKLFKLEVPDLLAVHELFKGFCVAAIITVPEDKALNTGGLRSKMPDMWEWNPAHVWARYEVVDIKFNQPA